jgi:excisionase family DNA binding protein
VVLPAYNNQSDEAAIADQAPAGGSNMARNKSKPEVQSGILPPTANGPIGDVLTLAEAAAYLRLADAEVIGLVHTQGLPGRPIGTEWRFLKGAIQQWLSSASPTLESQKQAQLALAGKYKDDPDLVRICKEAYQQRGRPMTEGE